MDSDVSRRTAFVTGASFGIGSAIALGLARDGFDVAVSATRIEHLADVVVELQATGARVIPFALDLRSLESLERATREAIERLGGLDVLVNNAGVSLRKAAIDTTLDEWDSVIGTNLTGTFFACQKAARHFIETGRPGCIVNLSSTYGFAGYGGRVAYSVSKAAIIHMTKTLAVEWAEHRIRVNAVAPGTVETRSRAAVLADPRFRQTLLDRVPLGRFGTAEEMAGAVRYLVSDAAAYITGQTLFVDGGLTACGAQGMGPK